MAPTDPGIPVPHRLYLDTSCLNRPFDDQTQPRIQEEAEAVLRILDYVQRGALVHVTSDAVLLELAAMRDVVRRANVQAFLPSPDKRLLLSRGTIKRA